MALSTRKINSIIADAKAGRHGSITNLCKHHKIDRKTYYKLKEKHKFEWGENAHIVEAATMVESAKRSTKNPQEATAIDKAVKERLEIEELESKIYKNNRRLLQGIQNVLSKKVLKAIQDDDEVTMQDLRSATGVISDAERIVKPKPEILINNENKQETKIVEVKFV